MVYLCLHLVRKTQKLLSYRGQPSPIPSYYPILIPPNHHQRTGKEQTANMIIILKSYNHILHKQKIIKHTTVTMKTKTMSGTLKITANAFTGSIHTVPTL